MSENESESQDRTQEATPKRKQDSRNKGEIPRSRELNTMMILMGTSSMLLFYGKHIFSNLAELMQNSFSFPREMLFSESNLLKFFLDSLTHAFLNLVPLFLVLFFIALMAPMLLGGWLFNTESLLPKFSRMSPLAGIKRMFSLKSLVELAKALVKFCLILSCGCWLIYSKFSEINHLGTEDTVSAIPHAIRLLSYDFIILSSSLIIIALFDVPYQLWEHARKLRMSHQDIKDEGKQTDGNPEMKGHIKKMQYNLAMKRMIEEIPTADVIITNPTHFAIALRYDLEKSGAPTLVAKGVDHMAEHIRNLAITNNVPIVSAPPLARSIYYHTEIFREIPEGLYVSVAKILAYIYQLKRYKKGESDEPLYPDELIIPDELKVQATEPVRSDDE